MSRSRNWRFTLNVDDAHLNWESDCDGLCDLGRHSSVRGLVFQEEMEERQHYQGFIRMHNPQTKRQMISLFEAYLGHTRTHFEDRCDFPKKAMEYCSREFYTKEDEKTHPGKKEGDRKRLSHEGIWEFGDLDFPQGKRSDLLDCKEIILQSKWKHAKLYEEHFGTAVRYMQGFEKAAFYLHKNKQEERAINVRWLWGQTGLGKSRDAREFAGNPDDLYVLNSNDGSGRVWFDGYEGEEILLIEEFDDKFMSIELLLQLTDRYRMKLPIKGAHTWKDWGIVIITAQLHYRDLYPFASPWKKEALARRITYEKKYSSEEILEREPEDHRFFRLRTAVSHTVSHRDIPAGADETGALPVDSGEDLPLEVTRSERSAARRRVLVEDSPHCTQTQLCERDELEERDVRCWEHLEASEETHCSDSGEQSADEPGASQQYAFSFPGYRSEEL